LESENKTKITPDPAEEKATRRPRPLMPVRIAKAIAAKKARQRLTRPSTFSDRSRRCPEFLCFFVHLLLPNYLFCACD